MNDELYVFVELKQKSFEKYIKARADVEKPGWYKASNRLLDDDDFHEFTAAETCAWIYIMGQSSIQQSSRVKLILDKVDALKRKFTREDLNCAIYKLQALKILKSGQPRNVDVTCVLHPVETGEERIGEDRKGGGASSSPPALASREGFLGAVLPDLSGNSKRDQVLAQIPIETQQDWLDTYDLAWLKNSILHAISNYAKDGPVDLVANWPEKLMRWFKIEKRPKLKSKAPVPKALMPVTVHSDTPLNEILSRNPEIAAVRARL